MSYFKWMLFFGWKHYIVPFLLIAVIWIGLYYDIFEGDYFSNGELWSQILPIFTLLASTVGMIYHSYSIWLKNRY